MKEKYKILLLFLLLEIIYLIFFLPFYFLGSIHGTYIIPGGPIAIFIVMLIELLRKRKD